MEISREFVRTIVFVLGPMVLASYVIGLRRADDPMALWGGIPESWRTLNVTCMFISAIGFLIVFQQLLFGWEASVVEGVGWPWSGEVSEGGHQRLLIAFLLVLIPSMFWLELTSLHIRTDAVWSQWLVIGCLWLVVTGNLLLMSFGWSAWQSDASGSSILPFVGASMLAIQVIINDGVLWVWKYPW